MRIIPLFVPHLGCTNDCVFCNQHTISGSKKPASAEDVHRAVQRAKEHNITPGAQLAFYGGSFTAIDEGIQTELLSTANAYIQSGYLSSLRISTRPDALNADKLRRLERYKVRTVELGAQSMCDEVLLLSKRGHNAEDTRRAANQLREYGFELILQMMTGLPGDSRERSLYTARELVSLKPDGVRIYPAVVIKNTELHRMWENGEYEALSVAEAVKLCAKLHGMFSDAEIPVIRMGLNPTDGLSGGEAAAGAYHPAFGELVYSQIMLDRAAKLLSARPQSDCVTLYVNKACRSQMAGHKSENLTILKERFALSELKIMTGDVDRLDVELGC